MTLTRRLVCILAGGGILWPSTVLAQAPRFYPDDPLRREPAPIAVTDAQPRSLSAILETVTNTLSLPGERHPEGAVIPAGGVNTLGEVMDGPWFVNRHGTTRMSPEELRRGPGDANPPDIARPWKVLVVKPYGVRPGIGVTDARGGLYLLQFDPPGSLGLATGAVMVASRVFHALGYHVGENYIVRFERRQLVPDETGQAVSSAGRTRPLIDADIDTFLGTVAQGSGGVFRAVATRLPRERTQFLGPYQVFGVRTDDPNDIVPHEHRRDLRGLFVFAAWLNHNNMRAVSTLDVLVDEGGIPHIRHYLLDFSTALGSSVFGGPKRAWEGHETFYPGLKTIGKNVSGLGLYTPSWMRADFRGPSAVGHIDFETFDPERWTTNHPITPFLNRLPDDTFWAARQVMAFTDEDIRTLVATGEYGDPEAEAWIVRCLIERRNRIGRAYLGGVLPLHHFRIENGALAFDDLETEYGFAQPRTYKAEWFTFDNGTGTLSPPLPGEGFRLPAAAVAAADGAYIAVRLTGAEPEKTVTVYVRKAGERFEVVGIDRRWPGRKDAEPSRVAHRGPSRYPNLDPVQRALFDKYAESYKARTGRTDSPQELFDRQTVSQQTTFDAVTHALMKSKLTAADGSDLGSPLDLIDNIDRVAGQYAGGGSDQQFRLYVQLKDGSREVLEKSQQFFRDHENTVYHAGYPHSYRQTGKEPNIQFSLSADGDARRHRRRLQIEPLAPGDVQWASDGGQLRRARRQEPQTPRRAVERVHRLVAGCVRSRQRCTQATSGPPGNGSPRCATDATSAGPRRGPDTGARRRRGAGVPDRLDRTAQVRRSARSRIVAVLRVSERGQRRQGGSARSRSSENGAAPVDGVRDRADRETAKPDRGRRSGPTEQSVADDCGPCVSTRVHAHANQRSRCTAVPVRPDDGAARHGVLRGVVPVQARGRRSAGPPLDTRERIMAARLLPADYAVRVAGHDARPGPTAFRGALAYRRLLVPRNRSESRGLSEKVSGGPVAGAPELSQISRCP